MTELLPEFSTLRVRGVFDGRARCVRPRKAAIFRSSLLREASIPVALVLFDVLEFDGKPTLALPYV